MNKYFKFNSTLAEVKKSQALDLKKYTVLTIVNQLKEVYSINHSKPA